MRVEIQLSKISLSKQVRRHVEEKVKKSLGRFQGRVSSVDLYLKDTNGPKGGLDKECIIHIKSDSDEDVTINTRSENIFSAINKGLSSAKTIFARKKSRKPRYKKAKKPFYALVDEPV